MLDRKRSYLTEKGLFSRKAAVRLENISALQQGCVTFSVQTFLRFRQSLKAQLLEHDPKVCCVAPDGMIHRLQGSQ